MWHVIIWTFPRSGTEVLEACDLLHLGERVAHDDFGICNFYGVVSRSLAEWPPRQSRLADPDWPIGQFRFTVWRFISGEVLALGGQLADS